ncbi:hypothetical protein HC891_28055 [Candidatus Gracilibacteria bacterium]|nr:hypothetical protein [Candidatus Gracilibacteria bacterium]
MTHKLSKLELIEIVTRLLQAEGTEEETLQWIEVLERNVPDPNVQGLIYWPHRYGLGNEPSAEEIVERALGYQAIRL